MKVGVLPVLGLSFRCRCLMGPIEGLGIRQFLARIEHILTTRDGDMLSRLKSAMRRLSWPPRNWLLPRIRTALLVARPGHAGYHD